MNRKVRTVLEQTLKHYNVTTIEVVCVVAGRSLRQSSLDRPAQNLRAKRK